MTSNTLNRLCKLWQKHLRLQDWVLTVELLPEDTQHADLKDSFGRPRFHVNH